jgi:hypothetical protein
MPNTFIRIPAESTLRHRSWPSYSPIYRSSFVIQINPISMTTQMEVSVASRWRRGLRDFIRKANSKTENEQPLSLFLSRLPTEIRVHIYRDVILANGDHVHIHMKRHESLRIVHSPCFAKGGNELSGDVQRRPSKREDWNHIHSSCAVKSLMRFPHHPEIPPGPPFPRRKPPPTGYFLPLLLVCRQM